MDDEMNALNQESTLEVSINSNCLNCKIFPRGGAKLGVCLLSQKR